MLDREHVYLTSGRYRWRISGSSLPPLWLPKCHHWYNSQLAKLNVAESRLEPRTVRLQGEYSTNYAMLTSVILLLLSLLTYTPSYLFIQVLFYRASAHTWPSASLPRVTSAIRPTKERRAPARRVGDTPGEGAPGSRASRRRYARRRSVGLPRIGWREACARSRVCWSSVK